MPCRESTYVYVIVFVGLYPNTVFLLNRFSATVPPGTRLVHTPTYTPLHAPQISDMASLKLGHLNDLKVLFLQGNEIAKVDGLEGCHELRELVLDKVHGTCLYTDERVSLYVFYPEECHVYTER